MAIQSKKRAASTVPTATGKSTLFCDTDGKWQSKDENGALSSLGGLDVVSVLPSSVTSAKLYVLDTTDETNVYLLIGSAKFRVQLEAI